MQILLMGYLKIELWSCQGQLKLGLELKDKEELSGFPFIDILTFKQAPATKLVLKTLLHLVIIVCFKNATAYFLTH